MLAQIVLADEINRTPPKTQSALLETMEEGRSRSTAPISPAQPFTVVATQNPIEYEGTYRCPRPNLIQFLMRVSLGYPNRSEEIEILSRQAAIR